MSKVGTRRNPRFAASALVAEDYFPRSLVETDAQLTLGQDLSFTLPPWGMMAFVSVVTPAVVGRFSGWRLSPTRPDGFWLVEGLMFQQGYWAMYPVEIAGANVQASITDMQGCSADEGWTSDPNEVGVAGELMDWVGPYAGVNALTYTSASVPFTARARLPVWCPRGSFIAFSHDVANVGTSGFVRIQMGGKRP